MTTSTLRPFSGPRHYENSMRANDDPHGADPCVYCGKGIKNGKATHFARVVDGGARFGTKDEPDNGPGEMGVWPVGPECCKKLAKAGVEVWKE